MTIIHIQNMNINIGWGISVHMLWFLGLISSIGSLEYTKNVYSRWFRFFLNLVSISVIPIRNMIEYHQWGTGLLFVASYFSSRYWSVVNLIQQFYSRNVLSVYLWLPLQAHLVLSINGFDVDLRIISCVILENFI